MNSIDRKFTICAISNTNGETHNEDDAVLFLARDSAFLLTLPTYLEKCKEVGAGPDQIRAVEMLIDRVKNFQASHATKVPDVDPATEPECLKP